MASDDPMIFQFHSSLQGSNFENDINDHHHHEDDDPHPHSLSRLSVCTNSTLCGVDDEDDGDDDDVDYGMARYMSGLSIESFEGDADADADADGELSDGRGDVPALFSDSENELSCRYPLPATPPPRRNLTPIAAAVKEYASDNEGKRGSTILTSRQETKENGNDMWRKQCRRMRKERDSKYWEKNRSKKKEEEVEELESRLSVSLPNSAVETSSGATSPIANWRISSPGDDPRDVKARLKVWAQAVAASASKYGT